MYRVILRSGLLLLVHGISAKAQGTLAPDSASRAISARPANDSLFRRARRLVGEGNGLAGRVLVDSLLKSADPHTPAYGDALYWHGVVALTAADAERDYRRVIVEYPLAYYKDDALLSLAELEQARGERAGALQHLQRYVKEHGPGRERGIAALGAARLAFDERDAKLGCAMLAESRASITTTEVELRNQIDAYNGRCAGQQVASAPVSLPVAATKPTIAPPVAPLAPPPARSRDSARSRDAGHFTVQLAAYETRPAAERLVAKLATRGVKARVSGTARPFRVRLGFYRTRKEAENEVSSLRKRGMIGFVAEETPQESRSP